MSDFAYSPKGPSVSVGACDGGPSQTATAVSESPFIRLVQAVNRLDEAASRAEYVRGRLVGHNTRDAAGSPETSSRGLLLDLLTVAGQIDTRVTEILDAMDAIERELP